MLVELRLSRRTSWGGSEGADGRGGEVMIRQMLSAAREVQRGKKGAVAAVHCIGTCWVESGMMLWRNGHHETMKATAHTHTTDPR
ncbi:hypothetical protein EYF80_012293 [Liparis tanakae]|uniref:Uncharacterized protein n=1 Tax=Liparis tanakae TaxID=230148 RepID=A0A4Z2IHJ5_9TELE|nr:hypothetical protein EYF80_012293 [Liparis tanakae]